MVQRDKFRDRSTAKHGSYLLCWGNVPDLCLAVVGQGAYGPPVKAGWKKIDIIIFYFSVLFQFLQWGILWDGAGFAGLFQTPIAAVLFAMEVLVAGELRSEALFPP